MATMRVMAVIEASTITGPAKNLLAFCRRARVAGEDGQAADVSIATFRRAARATGQGGEESDGFMDAARAGGVEVQVIDERFRFDPAIVGQLKAAVRGAAPDIVQTHGVKAHFLMRFAGLDTRYRWIAFHHGYTAEDVKMRLYNQLNRWSLPAAHRVITVCGPFADELARSGVERERITILPNSIEGPPRATDEETQAARERCGIREGERVILSIGRFSREKAQADLIPALGELAREYPGLAARLVLVGDGPEREKVARAANEAGLADRVVFAGHAPDVGPYYALADLFVLPSHSEGSPNVLLEAMAAGVPIAATAVGGVTEMVEHDESALLAPAGKPAALARAMGRLLSDRETAARLARGAARVLAERFSPEAYRRSLLTVYAGVCSSSQKLKLV